MTRPRQRRHDIRDAVYRLGMGRVDEYPSLRSPDISRGWTRQRSRQRRVPVQRSSERHLSANFWRLMAIAVRLDRQRAERRAR